MSRKRTIDELLLKIADEAAQARTEAAEAMCPVTNDNWICLLEEAYGAIKYLRFKHEAYHNIAEAQKRHTEEAHGAIKQLEERLDVFKQFQLDCDTLTGSLWPQNSTTRMLSRLLGELNASLSPPQQEEK